MLTNDHADNLSLFLVHLLLLAIYTVPFVMSLHFAGFRCRRISPGDTL